MTQHKTKFMMYDVDSATPITFYDTLDEVKEVVKDLMEQSCFDHDTEITSRDLDLELYRLPPGQKGKEFTLKIVNEIKIMEI